MMQKPSVRIAQIGLGYWGPNLLRNLLAIDDVEVVAVADLDERRRREARENRPRIDAAASHREILERPDVDAVVIATPAATHATMVEEALAAGKHVLVEKPLALDAAAARRLVALAAERGRVLMVGHTFLYNAAVRRLKEYVDGGELGEVYYLYAQRLNLGRVRHDVNALWNFAPHDVSIALYLLGDVPVEVSARGFSYLQNGIEDVAFVTLVFRESRSAHLHLSWLDPHKVRRLTVVGSRKMAAYDDVSAEARITLYDRGVDRVPSADSPRDFTSFAEFQLRLRSGDVTIPQIAFPEPLRTECEHFVACIRDGHAPLSGGEHGLDVVRVIEAAQRSMRESGAAVRLEEV
jgi:predicted dehydrogenase